MELIPQQTFILKTSIVVPLYSSMTESHSGSGVTIRYSLCTCVSVSVRSSSVRWHFRLRPNCCGVRSPTVPDRRWWSSTLLSHSAEERDSGVHPQLVRQQNEGLKTGGLDSVLFKDNKFSGSNTIKTIPTGDHLLTRSLLLTMSSGLPCLCVHESVPPDLRSTNYNVSFM